MVPQVITPTQTSPVLQKMPDSGDKVIIGHIPASEDPSSDYRTETQTEAGVFFLADHPTSVLWNIKRNYKRAGYALSSNDAQTSVDSSREILTGLETPVLMQDASDASPIYSHLENGADILVDAATAVFGLSGTETIASGLKWIHSHLHASTVSNADAINYVKLELLRAYKVMEQITEAKNPTIFSYGFALDIVRKTQAWIDKNVTDENTRLEAQYYTHLLSIEIMAHQLTLAVTHRNRVSRRRLTTAIREPFNELTYPSKILAKLNDPKKNDIVAQYAANIIILMARLGMWHEARKRAEWLTTNTYLKESEAATRIIEHELISRFVDHNGKIMSVQDIQREMRHRAVIRALKEGVANAYSPGIGHSIIAGGVGLVAGEISNIASGTDHSFILPLAGALLMSLGYRLYKGLTTEEAHDAYIYGLEPERSNEQTLKDIGRLAIKTGLDAAAWIAPAYFLESGHDSILKGIHTVAKGYGIYGGWITNAVSTITNPGTYAPLADPSNPVYDPAAITNFLYHGYTYGSAGVATANLYARTMLTTELREDNPLMASALEGWIKQTDKFLPYAAPGLALLGADIGAQLFNSTPTEILYGLYFAYTRAAGAIFLAHILAPELRWHLDKASWMFLPAAVAISADIRQWYKHDIPLSAPDVTQEDWINGFLRASIVSTEAIFMMLATKMVRWEKGETKTQTAWNFMKALSLSNKSMAMTIAMVNGLTSPISAKMQPAEKELVSLADFCLVGLATAIGNLPFTLGLSGLLKSKIPIKTMASEAWHDFKGQRIDRRVLEAIRGGLDAFTLPYAKNRTGRILIYDMIGAAARTYMGFDKGYASQIAMSLPNMISGNAASTLTWPEPSGTKWERASIRDKLEKAASKIRDKNTKIADVKHRLSEDLISSEDADKLIAKLKEDKAKYLETLFTTFSGSGQRMHPFHLLQPHNRLRDRLLPAWAIKQVLLPRDYPSSTNIDMYANLQQMMENRYDERIDKAEVEVLLDMILHYVTDVNAYKALQPLIMTLAFARNNPDTGEIIQEFFNRHPWTLDLLGIDIELLTPPAELSRRRNRKYVAKRLTTPPEEFNERVTGHANRPDFMGIFEGLFNFPPKALETQSGSSTITATAVPHKITGD